VIQKAPPCVDAVKCLSKPERFFGKWPLPETKLFWPEKWIRCAGQAGGTGIVLDCERPILHPLLQ